MRKIDPNQGANLALEVMQHAFANDCFESDMVVSVDTDWRSRPIDIRTTPAIDPVMTWYSDEHLAIVRSDPRGYWCHDAAIVRKRLGQLEVMVCVRSLSGKIIDGQTIHRSPIEGWLWFPGGRNRYDCTPTRDFDPVAPSQGDIVSLLNVLNTETGLIRDDCSGAWNLGVGVSFFPTHDIYKRGEWGVEFVMKTPQLTHNAIYVVEVRSDFVPVGNTIEKIRWITKAEFAGVRHEFCPYMQECLNAIFGKD